MGLIIPFAHPLLDNIVGRTLASGDFLLQVFEIDRLIFPSFVAVIMPFQSCPGDRNEFLGIVGQPDALDPCAKPPTMGGLIGRDAFFPAPFFDQIPGSPQRIIIVKDAFTQSRHG